MIIAMGRTRHARGEHERVELDRGAKRSFFVSNSLQSRTFLLMELDKPE